MAARASLLRHRAAQFAPMQNSQVILGGMKAARPRHNMKFRSYVEASQNIQELFMTSGGQGEKAVVEWLGGQQGAMLAARGHREHRRRLLRQGGR
jgi:hypothetical protein